MDGSLYIESVNVCSSIVESGMREDYGEQNVVQIDGHGYHRLSTHRPLDGDRERRICSSRESTVSHSVFIQ